MMQLDNIKKAYSFLAVCLVLLGVIIMVYPKVAMAVIYKTSGVVMILLGIVKLMGYFSKDPFQLAFQYDFAMGIVFALIGCFLLFWTDGMIKVVTICIGLMILVDALLRIQTTMDAKKFGISNWKLLLIVSFLVAGIGVLILFMPFETAEVMSRIIGLTFCIDGILNLVIVQSTVETIRRSKRWGV